VSRLPVLLVEDDLVVVHAGLNPLWMDLGSTAAALARAVPEHLNGTRNAQIAFATEVRYCDAAGRRPPQDDPPPGPPFMPWDHWLRDSRTVVFGHWARRGLVTGARVRGLDSGCVYGGALSAWIAEEDRLVQVPGIAYATRSS
jgi:bis(5'-nucleosyl)-tetraphosphatase (symmetrical)